jgi:hypothetical protein
MMLSATDCGRHDKAAILFLDS